MLRDATDGDMVTKTVLVEVDGSAEVELDMIDEDVDSVIVLYTV